MTCEIAVMNKRGLALAADSAVTVGEGEKIPSRREALCAPLGRASGNPDLRLRRNHGHAVEMVIHAYAQQLGARRFDRIGQYADDFFRFIEEFPIAVPAGLSTGLVPFARGHLLEEPVCRAAGASNEGRGEEILQRRKCHSPGTGGQRSKGMGDPRPEEPGAALGEKIVGEQQSFLDDIEREMFGAHRLNAEAVRGLRETVRLMLTRQWIPSARPLRYRVRRHG